MDVKMSIELIDIYLFQKVWPAHFHFLFDTSCLIKSRLNTSFQLTSDEESLSVKNEKKVSSFVI